MDCSLPGFSVCGISQARKVEWVAISSSTGSFWPKDQIHVSYIGRQIFFFFFFYHRATREASKKYYKKARGPFEEEQVWGG